jgi:hypothetical protein
LAAPFRRTLSTYLRLSDVLDILANLALVFITVESVNAVGDVFKLPKPILYAAAGYVIFTIWRFGLVVRARGARDHAFREAVCQVFHWLYREMFASQADRRFTLFVIDPLDSESLIPKVRYSPGSRTLMAEFKSSARYCRGEGSTGRAWEDPGSLLFNEFPQFGSREEFEAYYVSRLKIQRDTVRGLSSYMVNVRGIYSYGFMDARGDLLGVLSIDVQGDARRLDADPVEKLVRALGAVLEAHSVPQN